MRIVMHIDFDYFFAQIEEREKPWLRGRPVVVCVYSGRTEDSGAVSTANYEARRYEVRSGMPIALAKKRLHGKGGIFLPVNHALYEAVSEKVMTMIKRYADRFERIGIDEAFIEVTEQTEGCIEKAGDLAKAIKEEVKRAENLTCSIGVGPNKLVAKIASDYKKPDGLTVVTELEVDSFLAQMPVSKIPGVGRKTEALFKQLSINTVNDLAAFSSGRLVEIFGKKIGGYFYRASRGLDDEPVKERGEPKQFSRIATLAEDTLTRDAILKTLTRLAENLQREVTQQGYSFRTIGIMFVLDDLSLHSRSTTLEKPPGKPEGMIAEITKLLDASLSQLDRQVRRAGVKVSNLERVKGQKLMQDYFQ